MNFERELLFRSFPFVIVFWSETYSQIRAQKLAPDFWDWLSYKFHFDGTVENVKEGSPLLTAEKSPPPPIKDRSPIDHRIARRRHELEQMEESDDYNQQDRLSLLKNIADDYDELQEYGKAIYFTSKVLQEEDLLSEKEKGDYLNRLGLLNKHTGNYNLALPLYEQSLKIRQEIGDRKGEGTTLNNISQIHDAKGNYDTALGYLKKALKIQQEIGDRNGEGTTLNNISLIHSAKGDYDTALAYLEQSLKITQEIGDRNGKGQL